MSTADARPGSIGVVSRSASLTSEIVAQTSAASPRPSASAPIRFTASVRRLPAAFMDDDETEGVILIGEVGSNEEEAAAEYLGREKAAKARRGVGGGAPCPARAADGSRRRLHLPRPGRRNRQDRSAAGGGVRIAENADLVAATMHRALPEKAA